MRSKLIINFVSPPLLRIHHLPHPLTIILFRFEAEKFEQEPIFEKTINGVTSNHLKIITSIDMNVSAKTSNKYCFSYEHLKPDLMPCILLKSMQKSPPLYPNENTRLQTRKWWVPLRSAL